MQLVIDVSVMASWHFADEYRIESVALLDSLERRILDVRVPGIWWFEIHQMLLRGERRNRATLQQTEQFLLFVGALPITIVQGSDPGTILDLARRHQLSFYDAAYLELALREDIALATLDHALVRAAAAEGVALMAA
ncbi:PIN domain-containing protein [Tardiphaga alba]|uniref:PIN domain-containing protein n=1 Tax=Tardiphaga alba TaxID=340268 RepID=A0ABX8A7F0_9BRAD|nr:type II toxin-antitoxin system VapC family toxin [Tardiphaga alba]QUS37730.1 PIN domain-containing protein [Tardiphaga alba]